MINWRFILQPDTDDELEIEEPTGWDDTELTLVRDPVYHGVSIAFSKKGLELQGDGAAYVKNQYENEDNPDVSIRIIMECNDGEEEYTEDFSLDFSTYKESCGTDCRVEIAFTEKSCFTKFRNNFDKKVDLDKAVSFNGEPLTNYEGLRRELTLPPLPILVSSEGNVDDEGDVVDTEDFENISLAWAVRPTLLNVKYEAIQTSQLSAPSVIAAFREDIVSPLILFEDVRECFNVPFNVDLRLKGTIDLSDISDTGSTLTFLKAQLIQCEGSYLEGTPTILAEQLIASAVELDGTVQSFAFDISFTDPAHVINPGENIFMIVTGANTGAFEVHPVIHAEFDPLTYAKIEGIKECPATIAIVYLVFETISRVMEAISDKCLTLDSEYYGRTDSLPTNYDADGCGALRALTTGLYIRKAELPTYFQSMKELMQELRAIDNIGFALIKADDGTETLKVEPVKYFYNDFEVLSLPYISEGSLSSAINEMYGIIKVGYEKWEPEAINGLDEFNSTREYRTTKTLATQTLDVISKFIAGGYLFEITRQRSFSSTGAGDTPYDNDTFIICLDRDAYGTLSVEQGGTTAPDNLLFPDNVRNFRISPARNLLRWYKSIAGQYRVTGDLIFNAGTGNFIAEGMIDDDCAMENNVLPENDLINANDFKNPEDSTPILRPEMITFGYPMSLSEFLKLRANPYGYISYQCGTGEWFKGYLNKIAFNPSKGLASYDLRKKFE